MLFWVGKLWWSVIKWLFRSYSKFYRSSESFGMDVADVKKSSTFAPELIRELFWNSPNLLVISFSVINYVVSMRRPRASGEVSSFFVFGPWALQKNETISQPLSLRDIFCIFISIISEKRATPLAAGGGAHDLVVGGVLFRYNVIHLADASVAALQRLVQSRLL